MSDSPSLRLPTGMRDFAPRAAASRRRIAETLLAVFERWGFARVITPAFEYEEVLARGLGDATPFRGAGLGPGGGAAAGTRAAGGPPHRPPFLRRAGGRPPLLRGDRGAARAGRARPARAHSGGRGDGRRDRPERRRRA